MNKPVLHPQSVDHDIGPHDEHGQQIWSAEEEAAMERLHADPDYLAAIEEAEESFRRGEFYTHEEVLAHRSERRRQWREARGL